MKLDETDIKTLEILQKDGRITNARLASMIGISPPAMAERVKRLEATGIISRFVALVDRRRIGVGVVAYVSVSLSVHQRSSHQRFIEKITRLAEVQECYQVSGSSDFLLKVALKDLDSYSDFINNQLTGIEGIQQVNSTFVLQTYKQDTALPLFQEGEVQK